MSTRITVTYPTDAVLYKAGTEPCPELELDYLYSEQDKMWLVAGTSGNVFVKKRRTKPIDKAQKTLDEFVEGKKDAK